ncbi:MAG: hypothetical protein ABIO49_03580 [Dokdonella sp.]
MDDSKYPSWHVDVGVFAFSPSLHKPSISESPSGITVSAVTSVEQATMTVTKDAVKAVRRIKGLM